MRMHVGFASQLSFVHDFLFFPSNNALGIPHSPQTDRRTIKKVRGQVVELVNARNLFQTVRDATSLGSQN